MAGDIVRPSGLTIGDGDRLTGTTSRWRRPTSALAAVVALGALSACSSDDPPGTEGADGLTAPGTSLAFGDAALVPRTDGSAVIELTVTGVEQGDPEDLQGIGLDGADELVPFYVSYEMEVVSGDIQGFAMYRHLSAWSGDELRAPLIYAQPFEPCQEEYFPVEAAPGTTVTSCRTYLVPADGAAVDAVSFDNEDAYQYADGTAVEWD